jgi:hypothetical protein
MHKTKTLILSILLVIFWVNIAQAKVETMTVSQLEPGMKGVGRTVILGTTVEEFNVEIIGVLKKGGFNGGPMILIRCTGEVIDKTGGVAGGFSGSPVYINGKLIGALSSAWYFADHQIAGVTPIDEMLKNFRYTDEAEGEVKIARLDKPIEINNRSFNEVAIGMSNDETRELQKKLGDDALVLTACKTPLFVNGLNPQLVEYVKKTLEPQLPFFEIMSGPGNGMSGEGFGSIPVWEGPVQVEPGSAIGMQLVTGDIDLTAVGTLTYIDPDDPEKKFLAFGHPFLQRGHLEAPITSAKIVFTLPALDRSFKMGEALEIIGASNQDRSVAVSGYLGKKPDLIDINLKVVDLDQDRTKIYKFGIIPVEEYVPLLAMMPIAQGMNQVIDRSGQATAKMNFTIKGEGLAEPVKRENVYFSTAGGTSVLMEPMEMLSLLTTSNIFREVKITAIDIDVELTENRQTLDIVEIKYDEAPKAVTENPPAGGESSPNAQKTQELQELLSSLQEVPPSKDEKAQTNVVTMVSVKATEEMKTFKPGDTIRLKVSLKPFREEIYDDYFEIKIPDDINSGMTQVEVRGGGGYGNRFMQAQSMLAIPIGFTQIPISPGMMQEKPPRTLDEVIDEFLKRDHNNELIVELMRPPETDPNKLKEQLLNNEKQEPIKVVRSTDKVILGAFQLQLEIKKAEEAKKAAESDKGKTETKKKKDSKTRSRTTWKENMRNK